MHAEEGVVEEDGVAKEDGGGIDIEKGVGGGEGGKEKTQLKAKYPGDCIEAFKKLPPTEQARAKAFTFSYGGKPDETIEWSILGDTEQIVNCPMEEEQKRREEKEREAREEEDEFDMDMDMEEGGVSSPFTVDIPWDAEPANVDYNNVFLTHFFPSLEGKASMIDRFHADPRSPNFRMVSDRNICFERPHDTDPDKLVSAAVRHTVQCH